VSAVKRLTAKIKYITIADLTKPSNINITTRLTSIGDNLRRTLADAGPVLTDFVPLARTMADAKKWSGILAAVGFFFLQFLYCRLFLKL
jgi:hypothetical protein